jgi:hypothetical protein
MTGWRMITSRAFPIHHSQSISEHFRAFPCISIRDLRNESPNEEDHDREERVTTLSLQVAGTVTGQRIGQPELGQARFAHPCQPLLPDPTQLINVLCTPD